MTRCFAHVKLPCSSSSSSSSYIIPSSLHPSIWRRWGAEVDNMGFFIYTFGAKCCKINTAVIVALIRRSSTQHQPASQPTNHPRHATNPFARLLGLKHEKKRVLFTSTSRLRLPRHRTDFYNIRLVVLRRPSPSIHPSTTVNRQQNRSTAAVAIRLGFVGGGRWPYEAGKAK